MAMRPYAMRPYAMRPYMWVIRFHNPHNSVNMVGHDHEFIGEQFDFGADFRGTEPFLPHNVPQGVQHHLPIHDLPKQMCPVMGTDGDEIGARLGVIIPFQPDGTAPMSIGIVPIGHICVPPNEHVPMTHGRIAVRPYISVIRPNRTTCLAARFHAQRGARARGQPGSRPTVSSPC